MARVISTLLWLILAVFAGPAAACEGMSREAVAPTVARVEIVRVAVSSAPVSDAARALADTVCHLSSVCASVDGGEGGPVPGSTRVSRTSRPGDARGVSRPTSPPSPPPRSTFRI